MPRRQLPNIAPYGLWLGHITECQIIPHSLLIYLARKQARSKEGLDLRSKHQNRTIPVVIERFNSHSVSNEEKLLVKVVPRSNREHPVPIVNRARAFKDEAL